MFLPPSPTILNVIAVSGDWCDRESRSSGHETGPYDVAEDGGDAFHSAGCESATQRDCCFPFAAHGEAGTRDYG